MSQRRFRSDEFHVLTGWDRPCQMHFLVIEKSGADAPAYSNLSDPTLPFPGKMTVQQVFDTLDEFSIDPPDGLREALEADQRMDVGNKVVTYG